MAERVLTCYLLSHGIENGRGVPPERVDVHNRLAGGVEHGGRKEFERIDGRDRLVGIVVNCRVEEAKRVLRGDRPAVRVIVQARVLLCATWLQGFGGIPPYRCVHRFLPNLRLTCHLH